MYSKPKVWHCWSGWIRRLKKEVQVSSRELGVPLWPHDWGFAGFFRKLGGMVFDVEPVVLPSRNVGGEFI
jgi:hypothetical protein